MALQINFSEFDFAGFSTFLPIDAIASIVGLAKAYRHIDPIPDGTIVIKVDDKLDHSNQTQMLSNLLQSGTKVMDAIYYLHIHSVDDKELVKAFKVENNHEANVNNQTSSIKLLTASLIIFISRGQLPATQSANADTPLPRFITNVMGIKLQGEAQLRDAIMSFDPKHITMKSFFKQDHFKGWDAILQNRFALGVAGHKPLKAVVMLWRELDNNKRDELGYQILAKLHEAALAIGNGFYPSLHPYNQSFSTKYRAFYKNVIRMLFDYMTGSEEKRHETLMNLPMFKPDNYVKTELLKYRASYDTWVPNEIIRDLEEPITFGTKKESTATRSRLTIKTGVIRQSDIIHDPHEHSPEDQGSSSSSSATYGKTFKQKI